MLKKIFLAIIALFFILFGGLFLLMGYVFNNPEKVFNAFTNMTEKFLDGQSYEEKDEFFIQGIQSLEISARAGKVEVKTYPGSTLKIRLSGKIPRFEQGPFIQQIAEGPALNLKIHEPAASHWVQLHVNGEEITQESNSQIESEIFVPESFKGKLTVKTKTAPVKMILSSERLYEVELFSKSGEIANTLNQKPTSEVNTQEVGHIVVITDSGSIQISSQ